MESLWDAIARQKSRQEFFEYVSITKDIEAIAESFDNCECIEAANAMSKYLKKKKQNHSLVTLEFPNAYHGLVVCRDNPKEAISYTGKHVGILYKGNVYCNVYPKGLPYNDWITRFLAVDAETGEDITTPLITKKHYINKESTMRIIDWLFSIEGRVLTSIGSIYLKDLHFAIIGFLQAQRFISNDLNDPFYPGFQQFVESYYQLNNTAKSWDSLIAERTCTPEQALSVFFQLLHEYHNLSRA